MSMNDLMSDYVARVKNAVLAGKDVVPVLKNNLAVAVTNKLTKLGYFSAYSEEGYNINIAIVAGKINDIIRISKPGQRHYTKKDESTRITGGKGFTILTTSQGVMTHVEAKKAKVGGEVLFQIY